MIQDIYGPAVQAQVAPANASALHLLPLADVGTSTSVNRRYSMPEGTCTTAEVLSGRVGSRDVTVFATKGEDHLTHARVICHSQM